MAYDPNQPRVPAGQPGGGQWAGHGSEAAFREHHMRRQMEFGGPGMTESRAKRLVDEMVKEHLATAAARQDYHATRKPGPTLPQSLPSVLAPQARVALAAEMNRRAGLTKAPKVSADIAERNRLMSAGKPLPARLRGLPFK